MFLFIIITFFSLVDFDTVKSIIFNKNAPVIVALISVFIGAGIILGHIIHQVSMSLGFVVWTKRAIYFKKEYEMDYKIITGSYGSEIQRIYSYRLGNVHALRALWFSLLLSLLSIITLSFLVNFTLKIGILITVVFVINIIVLNNWIYFQNNLDYFLRKIKSDF